MKTEKKTESENKTWKPAENVGQESPKSRLRNKGMGERTQLPHLDTSSQGSDQAN
jgi:hypothetical protein